MTTAIDAFRHDTATEPLSIDALIPDYLHAAPHGWEVRVGDGGNLVEVVPIPQGVCD